MEKQCVYSQAFIATNVSLSSCEVPRISISEEMFFFQGLYGFLWGSRILFYYQLLYSLQFLLSQDVYV